MMMVMVVMMMMMMMMMMSFAKSFLSSSAPLKGSCWFCLGSPQVEKHLVVSVGDDVSGFLFANQSNY